MKNDRANGAVNDVASGRSIRRRSQRGTATLEMAIVLPLVGGVVMGFIDLGRVYELHTSLTNAAHQGAAYASFNPNEVEAVDGACTDPGNVVFATRNEQGTSSPFNVEVHYTSEYSESSTTTWTPISGCGSAVPAARVRVTASAPFRPLTPLVAALVGKSVTLDVSSEVVVQ
jgi:Flp pilus assembly protein TadG